MLPPVLTTKLFAPTRRQALVARPRLSQPLSVALDMGHRLTLVSAPAGFGKTTVLSDWADRLRRYRPTSRIGWLSLDEGDNDLTRLLSHLVAALDRVGMDVDSTMLDSLRSGSCSAALTALVNDMTRTGADAAAEQCVLVLDDYHVIGSSEVHAAMTFLIDRLPDRLHLVVATRADPPLPLARLRARGQLTEVRAADLRFTAHETREFLTQTMGLDLTGREIEALEERTEGWIAGLQLAALSLGGIPDRGGVAAFIDEFAGSNRFVIDYLADEVLAGQSDEVRDFLLRTAVLDRFTGPLCDAVTGRMDSGQMLERLERANLFLFPLDNERSWYRYHHLFADVLQARLRAEAPLDIPGLHQRASAWFAAAGLTPDAVRHALAAADNVRAGRLIEEALPELRRTRQDSLMLTWVRSLPGAVIIRSPVLSILSGWSLMMAGDLDAAESRFDDSTRALAAGIKDERAAAAWADTDDLRTAPATIAVYRASLAQARGDVSGTRHHAQHALELAGPSDHFVRGAGEGFLGMAAWATGDIPEALSTFSRAVRSLHAAGNLVDELDASVVLADLWVASGRLGRARDVCDQALQAATEGRVPHARASADLHVALAEVDRELDNLAGAEAHLRKAQILAKRAFITENQHRWFVVMAQVRSAAGDYETAIHLLDEAQEAHRPGTYPDVRPIPAMKARVHITAGDLSAASAWADDCGVGLGDDPNYLREYEHLTLVRLLLAVDASQAALVLDLLTRLRTAAVAAGRDGSIAEIDVLRARAHQVLGDLPRALAVLGQALVWPPEPESRLRVYLDEGTPMIDLLRTSADRERCRDRLISCSCGPERTGRSAARNTTMVRRRSSPWWTRSADASLRCSGCWRAT